MSTLTFKHMTRTLCLMMFLLAMVATQSITSTMSLNVTSSALPSTETTLSPNTTSSMAPTNTANTEIVSTIAITETIGSGDMDITLFLSDTESVSLDDQSTPLIVTMTTEEETINATSILPTVVPTSIPAVTGAPTLSNNMPESTPTSEPASEEISTTTEKNVQTEQNIIPGLAVGIGVTFAVLVILIVILCSLICGLHKFKNKERKHKKIVEFALQEVNGDDKLLVQDVLYGHIHANSMVSIPAEKLLTFVPELHRDNCYNADEEYESIKDKDPEFSKHAASQDCNENKNRYINILPRDETRVVLSTIPKIHGSDYMNANYIDGYNHENEYIASQGPLPNTTIDFWRMIWEQNVHIIVMVTNPVENGMVKCHEYWPKRGVGQYGTMVVTLVGEKLFPEFIVRTFTLTMTSRSKKMSQVCVVREITQYHFTDWPDFGVPENASSMLKFVRRVRNATSPTHGPVVIHCSAGVGRTGTFIAIDVMLQKMAAKENLNVPEFVCRMRAQRAYMIQTSAQYLFVYDALLHAFIHGCTEVKSSMLGTHLALIDKPLSDEAETTTLDQEFHHVKSLRFPSDHFFSVAMEECNAAKNRSIQNLPLDHNRVILEDVDKAAGEDYINASFIDGYYNRVEFIATQHPVPTTRGDMWRMLLERDVNTLVVIGALEDDYDCYWPVEGMHEYDGGITVDLKDTEEMEDAKITKRTFHVSMEQSDSFVSVSQFHLHGWPREGVPPSASMMLELVEQSRKHWRETGFNLIAVHTATDVQSEVSGVYCGACILLRQLEVEGCADVVTTAQKLRQKRPAIITDKEYYRYLYEILVSTL